MTRFSGAKSKRWSPPASPETRSQKQYCTLILQAKRQLLPARRKMQLLSLQQVDFGRECFFCVQRAKEHELVTKEKEAKRMLPPESLRERVPASSAWTERRWRQQSQQVSAIKGKKTA